MLFKNLSIPIAAIAVTYAWPASADTSDANAELKRQYNECKASPQPGCKKIKQLYAALGRDSAHSRAAATESRASGLPTKAPPTPVPSASTTYQIGPLFSGTTDPSSCIPITKALYVRADPLDNFHYFVDYQDPNKPTAADAEGLTVSYTNDRVAATQSATIDGRISYLIWGEQCQALTNKPYVSAIGIAPFVSSNGTWTNPPPKKLSNSVDKAGVDFAFSLATTDWYPFIDQYFFISPYYQTDFQSRARIDGVVLAWEPVAPPLYLGSGGPVTPYYSFFWQLRPEVDLLSVSQPGLTNLTVGRHTWMGETVRGTLALFPLTRDPVTDWFSLIAGRFAIIGTASNFYDSRTRAWADYYTATLQYKLGPCVKDSSGKDLTAPCSIQGSSSISFEYDAGTDKDSLVFAKKYLIKLGYAY